MKKGDSILFSLLESGKIDKEQEMNICVELHKSGVLDVVKLVSEAIADFKAVLSNGIKAEKLDKINSAIEYLQLAKQIIEAEDDNPVLESVPPVDETPRATATVIGAR